MKRSAFTLVELLVVISIIGLLSSIAVVSLSSSRDKAAIAAGLQFEASVQHAVGSEALAIWDFDESSGATAGDSSGNGRNATLVNGPTRRCASANASNTPSGQGCALVFDGTNDYVTTPALGMSDGTVSLWFYNRNLAIATVLAGKRSGGCFSSSVYLNPPNDLRIYNTGPEASIGLIQQNKWYHLVVVRAGSGAEANFYLNGKLMLKNAYNLNLNDFISTIGSSCAGTNPMNGYVDNVRVYGTALGASRIEKIFAEERVKYNT